MPQICIRLDDVHGRTPLAVLRRLDTELWPGIPVTMAVIPYPAYGCLGPAATPHEQGVGRSTLGSSAHGEYLVERAEQGTEIAVHGLTHADHRHPRGRSASELVAVSPQRVSRLGQVIQRWRGEFGTTVLVPPHNYVDAELSQRLANSGVTVCRAITDTEVASLGLNPQQPGDRLTAKRLISYRTSPHAIEIFQTLALSPSTPGLRDRPEAIADTLLDVAHNAGVAVATLHWWDFTGARAEDFTARAAEIIRRLHTDPTVEFTTIGQFAISATTPTGRGPMSGA